MWLSGHVFIKPLHKILKQMVTAYISETLQLELSPVGRMGEAVVEAGQGHRGNCRATWDVRGLTYQVCQG